MKHFSVGHRLPRQLAAPLFGDRRRFGLTVRHDDLCWRQWEKTYLEFYDMSQKRSIGALVNAGGYRIMSRIDLSDKRVLEVGPGEIEHLPHWRGMPECYVLADISNQMLDRSSVRLSAANVPHACRLVTRANEGRLPFDDAEFDVVVSFYTFEHLYPFADHLREMRRVLKPGGLIVGAIPCEGGLAWGLGRFLTTRRWLKRHTTINPDKIICWEHPNFAETLMETMDSELVRRHVSYWPLTIPSIDLNLVIRFVYANDEPLS